MKVTSDDLRRFSKQIILKNIGAVAGQPIYVQQRLSTLALR